MFCFTPPPPGVLSVGHPDQPRIPLVQIGSCTMLYLTLHAAVIMKIAKIRGAESDPNVVFLLNIEMHGFLIRSKSLFLSEEPGYVPCFGRPTLAKNTELFDKYRNFKTVFFGTIARAMINLHFRFQRRILIITDNVHGCIDHTEGVCSSWILPINSLGRPRLCLHKVPEGLDAKGWSHRIDHRSLLSTCHDFFFSFLKYGISYILI